MADYTLAAKITADGSNFKKAFKETAQIAQELSDKVKGISDKVSDFGKKTAMTGAGITAGITTPFVGAIKMTADFDSAMRKAGAIAGASATELDAMTKSALDLGASTSLSSSQVAVAMTDMAAKGFDANQVIAAMPGVIAAAEASGEDLALTANTVAAALNGFQLKAEDSGKVADILAMAANKTAAGVSDMSYAFKYAAAPAASLGISIEELSAATGLMVNAGLDGSQAGTSLRMALIRLAKPTEESSKTMEKLGFDVLDAKGNFKPLNEIIGELTKSMDGMTEAQKLANLATIFGTEAATGMLILMNQGQKGIKGLTTELENSSGASAEAAAQMKAGIGGALENLSGAIESATITLMSKLTPFITDLAKWTTSIVEKFNNLDEGTMTMIAMAAGIVAASGPVLSILGLMAMGIGGLVSAVGFLISPIGLVIAAITGLAAAFGYFMATNEAFRNNVISVFQSVSGYIQGFISKVAGMGPQIMSVLGSVGSQIGAVFQTVWSIVQTIVPIFTTFFSSLISGFQSAGGVGSGFGMQLIAMLMGLNPILKMVMMLFQNFGPQITAAFQQVAAMVIPVMATLGTALGQLASSVIPVFMGAFTSLLPVIAQLGSILMSTIITLLPIIINLFNNLVPIIMMLVQQFSSVIAVIIPLVVNLVSALIPAVSMLIQGIMNIVTAVAPSFISIVQAIGAAIQVLLPVISSILQTVIHVMTNIITVVTPIIGFIVMVISTIIAIIAPIVTYIAGVMTAIFSVIRPIITVVTGVFDTVTQVISSVWQGVMRFTGQIFTSIGTIVSGLSSVVSGVFSAISSTIARTMDRVSSKISGVFDNIRSAWKGLTGFVGGVFNGISGAVSELVNQVKGFVNNVIGGVNGAVGLINKIPGVEISKIPMLARGTDNWQGGFAMMNEGGRGEMVSLPGGSQVIPHDVSMRYAREAGRNTSDNASELGSASFQRMEELLERIAATEERIANKEQSLFLDTGALVGGTFNEYDRVGGTKTVLTERWEY